MTPTIIGDATLYCGDCLEILPTLGKVDAVVTDPPYGVDYTGGFFNKVKRDGLVGDSSTSLYKMLMPLVFGICSGPVYLFFADTRGRDVYDAVEDSGGQIHALIIWHKINATYAAMNAQYKQRHEPCLYCKKRGGNLLWTGPSNECTVWEIRKSSINSFHPTQKPVAVMERAIRNHSVSIVCDPFMGGGSTGVACANLNRRFVGIEIEPKYFDIACKRIEVAYQQPRLFDDKELDRPVQGELL